MICTSRYDIINIMPYAVIRIKFIELDRRYLHESNILSARAGKEEFHLYIINADGGGLKCSVCGISGEHKRLSELVRSGSAALPLSFEGRQIGTARVVDMIDIPEEKEYRHSL